MGTSALNRPTVVTPPSHSNWSIALRFLPLRPTDPRVITVVFAADLAGRIALSSALRFGLATKNGASESDRVRKGGNRLGPSLWGKLASVGDGSAIVVALLARSSAARSLAERGGNGGGSQVAYDISGAFLRDTSTAIQLISVVSNL